MADFASPRFADDDELVRILNSPDDGSDKLVPGNSSDGVCRVQRALYDLGWAGDFGVPDFVTGFFGERTEAAALAYKRHYDIHFPPDAPTGSFDGFVGPRTLASLDRHCVALDAGTAAIDAKVRALADAGVGVVSGPITSIMHATLGVVRACTINGTDGAIYFLDGVGAFEVHGAIHAEFTVAHGGPEGDLGYPVSDEHPDGADAVRSDFQAGSLRYSFTTAALEALGPVGGVPVVVGPAGESDRIVVKLFDDVAVPYEDGVEQHLAAIVGDTFATLQGAFPFLTLDRLFTSADPSDIDAWLSTLVARGLDAPPLRSFFAVEPPPGVDPRPVAQALYDALSVVEMAYLQPPCSQPAFVDPSDDPLSGQQNHLNAAPVGIDAAFAWTRFGGDGTGVRVVDVEGDCRFDHEDLVDAAIALSQGRRSGLASEIDHGTGVLGLLVGGDNALGGVGIVPRATALLASDRRAGDGRWDLADALLLLAVGLAPSPTTVVLLEQQLGQDTRGDPLRPVEIDPAINGLVRGLVASGITVVEAAGNGGLDLDMFATADGHMSTRDNDTGAIMVGAGLDPEGEFPCGALPSQRASFSNHGARIDCWAIGRGVTTASSAGAAGPTSSYTAAFGGTSAASAIVAGAAVALHGMSDAAGRPLAPIEVRALLADPTLNTPSAVPGRDRIGVMPDLAAIVTALEAG
ncbi:MAG: S8 family serine peptidase [Thermoleophilia bacterium]